MKPNTGFFLKDSGGGSGAGAGGQTGAGGGSGGGAGGSAGGANGGAGGAGGGTGGGGDPWYQGSVGKIKPETLAYLDGKKFANLEAALDSGALSDKMARERNVIARPDTSDPAKLREWEGWGTLGWNKDKGEYAKAIKPPKMPNNAQHDAALMDAFVGLAHENQVPAAAAEKLFHGMNDFVNGRLSTLASDGIKANDKLAGELREAWGTDYEKNTELAKRAAKAAGIGVDDASELEKLVGSPRLLKTFHKLGTLMGEASLVGGDGQGGTAGMTPASAEAELRRLEADPEFLKAFTDRRNPQHEDKKAQWQKLTDRVAQGQQQRRRA